MSTNLITAVITAYCACKTCCGPLAKGITASGVVPKAGVTISIPRRYPFGTLVILNGHTYIGQDRTSKQFDGRLDIYCKTHAEAKRFGIHTNRVIVVIPETSFR